MSLAELSRKPVRTVEGSCTLIEAARQMIQHSVGALVITDPGGSVPTGIITDRDIVVLLAEGLDPGSMTVGCLVKAPLETVSIHEGLREVTDRMHKHGVRRLPIVDTDGKLVGLVSLDDVLIRLGREMADVAAAVEEEIGHEKSMQAVRDLLRKTGKEPVS